MAKATKKKAIRWLSYEDVSKIQTSWAHIIDDIKTNVTNGNENHFDHIAGSCITFLRFTEEDYKKHGTAIFLPNLRDLRDYFNLLVDYDDYCKGEMSSEKGYFPNLRDNGEGGARNYIQESKSLLEKP